MDTLRATEIFKDSRHTLIAIESVDFKYSKPDNIYRLHGKVEPIAVVVCGPDEIYALDMEANYTVLAKLIHDVPKLDTIIKSVKKT